MPSISDLGKSLKLVKSPKLSNHSMAQLLS